MTHKKKRKSRGFGNIISDITNTPGQIQSSLAVSNRIKEFNDNKKNQSRGGSSIVNDIVNTPKQVVSSLAVTERIDQFDKAKEGLQKSFPGVIDPVLMANEIDMLGKLRRGEISAKEFFLNSKKFSPATRLRAHQILTERFGPEAKGRRAAKERIAERNRRRLNPQGVPADPARVAAAEAELHRRADERGRERIDEFGNPDPSGKERAEVRKLRRERIRAMSPAERRKFLQAERRARIDAANTRRAEFDERLTAENARRDAEGRPRLSARKMGALEEQNLKRRQGIRNTANRQLAKQGKQLLPDLTLPRTGLQLTLRRDGSFEVNVPDGSVLDPAELAQLGIGVGAIFTDQGGRTFTRTGQGVQAVQFDPNTGKFNLVGGFDTDFEVKSIRDQVSRIATFANASGNPRFQGDVFAAQGKLESVMRAVNRARPGSQEELRLLDAAANIANDLSGLAATNGYNAANQLLLDQEKEGKALDDYRAGLPEALQGLVVEKDGIPTITMPAVAIEHAIDQWKRQHDVPTDDEKKAAVDAFDRAKARLEEIAKKSGGELTDAQRVENQADKIAGRPPRHKVSGVEVTTEAIIKEVQREEKQRRDVEEGLRPPPATQPPQPSGVPGPQFFTTKGGKRVTMSLLEEFANKRNISVAEVAESLGIEGIPLPPSPINAEESAERNRRLPHGMFIQSKKSFTPVSLPKIERK